MWGPGDLVLGRSSLKSWKTGIRFANVTTVTSAPWSQCPWKETWREDPRFFIWDDQLYLSYTVLSVIDYVQPTYRVSQRTAFSRFDSNFNDEVFLDIGNNRHVSPDKFRWEKNWVFFESGDSGTKYVIYSISPRFVVFDVSDRLLPTLVQNYSVATDPVQELRGGSSPILLNGTYYMFVHTSAYDMYCVTFTPSLLIKTIALVPTSYRAFACGAVFDAQHRSWVVSLGSWHSGHLMTDMFATFLRFSHDHLLELLGT